MSSLHKRFMSPASPVRRDVVWMTGENLAVGDFADFSSQMASTAISSLTTYGSDSSDDDSDDGTAPRSPQPGPPR